MQINFHRKTGLKPDFGLSMDRFGPGTVYSIRAGWIALTLTILRGAKAL